jgi:hypothetical protein
MNDATRIDVLGISGSLGTVRAQYHLRQCFVSLWIRILK